MSYSIIQSNHSTTICSFLSLLMLSWMNQSWKAQITSVSTLQKVVDVLTYVYCIIDLFKDGGSPIMAYAAACSLSSQTTLATLDLQVDTLTPSPTQTTFQPWTLWSPSMESGPIITTEVWFTSSHVHNYVFKYIWTGWYGVLPNCIWNLPRKWICRLLSDEQVC